MPTPNQSATPNPTIGPITLSSPVLLAPMAGVADAPFREICRDYGVGLSTAEMLTSDIGLWHQPKSQWRLKWAANEKPVSIQIAGTEPSLMAQAAKACEDFGAQIIDINMGCPAKKVCKKAAGSALMAHEEQIDAIVRAVVNAVSCPVTVKTRTGIDIDSQNAASVAQICEAAGAKAIAIHGRTKACKFQGEAEHNTVKIVKNAISIPVFANGDVKTAKEAKCILDETSVDGIMIGRAALGQPWLLRQIHEYLAHGCVLPEPSLDEKYSVVDRHLRKLHDFYGTEVGIRIARKHVSWYLQHLPGGESHRKAFVLARSVDEQYQILDQYFQHLVTERCL